MFRAPAERCPIDGARLHGGARDPLLGTWLVGRFLIEEMVGDGPLGRVYRARDLRDRRELAVRVLAGERAADPAERARFHRRAELARRLDHPNVVPVADVGTTGEGLSFLVTDYVPGRALSRVLTREGPLTRERALALLRQIADGLAHAHDRGVLHRDLRPENVILAPDRRRGERARIVDFAIGGGAGGDPRRDLAGLGAVLREMIARVAPDDRRSRRRGRRTSRAALADLDLARLAEQLEADPASCLRRLGLVGEGPDRPAGPGDGQPAWPGRSRPRSGSG